MKTKFIFFSLFTFLLLTNFQNCAKPFQVAMTEQASLSQQAANCMQSSAEACLFSKNAVAQSGKSVNLDFIGALQTQAASLENRDNSGFLQNGHFVVTTSNTERISSAKGFKHYYSPQNSYLEQVMAYSVLEQTQSWMNNRQMTALNGKAIKVYVDSGTNLWVPARNEIHLQRETAHFPAALDASLILHLYAQAAVWHSTTGQSHSNLATKATSCNDQMGFTHPYGCCLSANGCGPAIVNGVADAMVAIRYPAQPLIGDGYKNSISGLQVCGLQRNANLNLTAAEVAQRCSSRGSPAQVHALGIVYASIWMRAMQKAQDKYEFEKFFLRHLSLIRGEDDFISIKAKILALDSNEFSGHFGNIISTEFAQRGL